MDAKTEVYSWRISPATKSRLEEVARRQRRSVAQLLDEIVSERLNTSEDDSTVADLEHQRELHRKAAQFAGCIVGNDPRRSERVRSLVRARLERRVRAR